MLPSPAGPFDYETLPPRTYQVMSDMRPEKSEMLKADIAERGIQVPIDVDEQGNIPHRYFSGLRSR
jgi:hypothetical protein